MSKLTVDIQSENFNFFFANECADMLEYQKAQIPHKWLAKMFKANGEFRKTSDTLPFLAKIYILYKALGKRFFIVMDSEQGVDKQDFLQLMNGEILEPEQAIDKLRVGGMFVLGNKELSDGVSRVHALASGPTYNFLVKSKNTAPSKIAEHSRQMAYIGKLISHYEGRRKKWQLEFGLTSQEWYLLTYILDGKEYVFRKIVSDVYSNAMAATRPMLQTALTSLRRKGYVDKIGATKFAKIKITALGKEVTQAIISRFFLNF